jgi:hypothetical protein
MFIHDSFFNYLINKFDLVGIIESKVIYVKLRRELIYHFWLNKYLVICTIKHIMLLLKKELMGF